MRIPRTIFDRFCQLEPISPGYIGMMKTLADKSMVGHDICVSGPEDVTLRVHDANVLRNYVQQAAGA